MFGSIFALNNSAYLHAYPPQTTQPEPAFYQNKPKSNFRTDIVQRELRMASVDVREWPDGKSLALSSGKLAKSTKFLLICLRRLGRGVEGEEGGYGHGGG